MKDLIIVGKGLAAFVLAHTCKKHNLHFHIIGKEDLSHCSRVAAGIWNPVVFKRLTKSWMADKLIPFLNTFYSACEKTCKTTFITQRTFIRPFSEEQEKKLWKMKSANELDDFLDHQISETGDVKYSFFKIEKGFGKVLGAGNLDMKEFLDSSAAFFKEVTSDEIFDHSKLYIGNQHVSYGNISAKKIVFCEGHLIHKNPFFSFIPMKPVKGEILEVELKNTGIQDHIINKGGFLMDTGKDIFKAGATYDWDAPEEIPTHEGKKEIQDNIGEIVSGPYKIISHKAGIRPAVIDRRPVIGAHPAHPALFVFNGMGTKGVMLAPYFAENFVLFLLGKNELHPEVNVRRFHSLYHETSNT